MDYFLRTLTSSDQTFIKRVYQDATIMLHIGDVLSDKKAVKIFKSMLNEMHNKKAIYYVICCSTNDEQVGLCSMQWKPESASIVSGMIVLPSYQNLGICKWAQIAGMKKVMKSYPAKTCTVFINKLNKAALKSYLNMGFLLVSENAKSRYQSGMNQLDFSMELLRK